MSSTQAISQYQTFNKIPLHRDSVDRFGYLKSRTKPVFLIDIDNTLYKENNGMDTEIREKIFDFCSIFSSHDEAKTLMTEYYFKYGHTLRGYLCETSDPLCNVETWKQVYDKVDIEKYLVCDPEMYEKLKQFTQNNILYAFTNGDCDIGMRMLKSLGLIDLFEGIIYCDYKNGGNFICKPDKEAYELTEEIFGKKNLFIFEDRMINLEEPMKLGWECYFVDVERDLKSVLHDLSGLK